MPPVRKRQTYVVCVILIGGAISQLIDMLTDQASSLHVTMFVGYIAAAALSFDSMRRRQQRARL